MRLLVRTSVGLLGLMLLPAAASAELRHVQIKIVDRDGKQILDLLNGATMELESRPATTPGGAVDVTGVSVERARDVERVTITGIK